MFVLFYAQKMQDDVQMYRRKFVKDLKCIADVHENPDKNPQDLSHARKSTKSDEDEHMLPEDFCNARKSTKSDEDEHVLPKDNCIMNADRRYVQESPRTDQTLSPSNEHAVPEDDALLALVLKMTVGNNKKHQRRSSDGCTAAAPKRKKLSTQD
jgi:hypothetical protein